MSWVGFGGAIVTVLLLLALVKPMRKSMEEDVFLKIGGNRDKLMLFKYESYSRTFLKVDFINSALFFTTSYFYVYSTNNENNSQLMRFLVISLIAIL